MPFDITARIAEWRRNLLDVSKRNRLVKFVSGRNGGVHLLAPKFSDAWLRIAVEGRPVEFPWKRDLLGLPASEIDGDLASPSYPEAAERASPAEMSAVDSAELALVDAAEGGPRGPAAEPLAPSELPAPANGASAVGSAGGARRPRAQERSSRELTEECLASPYLRPDQAVTEYTDKALAAHLLRLSRTSAEAEHEHGVSTLYLAFGFLRWFESADSEEEIRSPLVLVPVSLTRANVDSAWRMSSQGDDPVVNACLAQLLKLDFKIELPASAEGEFDTEALGGVLAYLGRVAEAVKSLPRWSIEEECAIGVFNFQKLAMWQDLERNQQYIGEHDVCRAIAGDFKVQIRPPAGLVRSDELDEKVPLETVNLVLDADSSQQEAIEAIKRGANVVVDGPPGTGKSQTIANAIAELMGVGKTILFVSEKTAALEVVKRRLDERGLGDFCLELHSHKANKRALASELGRCLDLEPEATWNPAEAKRDTAKLRRVLNAYVEELHRPRQPLDRSAFQVHGELARLADLPDDSRWSTPDVFAKDGEFVRRACEVLNGLVRCRAVVEPYPLHPWRGCLLASLSQSVLSDVRHQLIELATSIDAVAAGSFAGDLPSVGPLDTVAKFKTAVRLSAILLAMPKLPTSWFAADPRKAAQSAIALHEATSEIRHLQRDFSAAAIQGATPEEATQLAARLADSLGPRPHEENSVRGELAYLDRRASQTQAVATAIHRVLEASQRVQQYLSIPYRENSLGESQVLAKMADDVASTAPIPVTWWSPERLREVQSLAARGEMEEGAAKAIRSGLADVFSREAFADEAGPLVREAVYFGASFWRRWTSRWRELRARIAGWLIVQPPPHVDLMAKLQELAEFHRHNACARGLADDLAPELGLGPAERLDWTSTARTLNSCTALLRWPIGPELQAALAPEGQFDRASLGRLRVELVAACTELEAAWVASGPSMPSSYAEMLELRLGVVADRVQADGRAAADRAAALRRMAELLAVGVDVPVESAARKASELAELLKLRGRALARLVNYRGPPDRIWSKDWGREADAAKKLLEFVPATVSHFPTELVPALTDAGVRERLQSARKAAEELLQIRLEESWTQVAGVYFPPDQPVSDGLILSQATFSELAVWIRSRLADLHRLEEWVRFGQLRREADALGVGTIVDEVCSGRVSLDNTADAFRRRFFGLWLDALYVQTPLLAEFAADKHDDLVGRFAKLDAAVVRGTAAELRGRLLSLAQRPSSGEDAPASSELGVLLHEVHKKKKHLPVLKLIATIPSVLRRLKPCLMMSPLSASTFLGSSDYRFDVVIFDEASQVRPHDAISAIFRGRQLVVAGDPQQLPPSDFFSRSTVEGEEDDSAGGTSNFESLLDVCLSLGLVRKRLKWHYRSRSETLIAFSNKHFYNGGLVTFPSASAADEAAVRLENVLGGAFADGINPREARRVAELVIEHFQKSPDYSLGVIAFSQAQQNRILDELESLRRTNSKLEEFFAEDRTERFFVKNLENVQGDERDSIILGVGYGPNAAGKISMNFGPLNRQGGERRLNVAVTRARRSLVVASSMTAADVDLSRTASKGAILLREFLDFAARGPKALATAVTEADSAPFDSSFEVEVFEELRRRGLTLHRQVGCGGYRIDMAVVDPAQEGRYLLGIECDGAAYHSSATARDRDRLRQSMLEGLGWRLFRIWSTDWIKNRERQVQRVMECLKGSPHPRSAVPEPKPSAMRSFLTRREDGPLIQPSYRDIDEVPEAVVCGAALAVVAEFGATGHDDLCQAVVRRLGFKRQGSRIRIKIDRAIEVLGQEQKLERCDDGRWKLHAEVR